MNEQLLFRRAAAADIPRIMRIIARAQAQMRAAGSLQWQDGYPAESDIARDIGRGTDTCCRFRRRIRPPDPPGVRCRIGIPFRTCCPGGSAAGEAVAYGSAVFDGEPAYAGIEGRWLTDGAYVVLHRLAVAGGMQGRGLATAFLRRVGELARRRGVCAFRVDTNFDNRRMLRLLEKEGFRFCGTVRYAGGERLAFEKRL